MIICMMLLFFFQSLSLGELWNHGWETLICSIPSCSCQDISLSFLILSVYSFILSRSQPIHFIPLKASVYSIYSSQGQYSIQHFHAFNLFIIVICQSVSVYLNSQFINSSQNLSILYSILLMFSDKLILPNSQTKFLL